MDSIRDKVVLKHAEILREKYKKQPTQDSRQTILASFVILNLQNQQSFIISVATGTKSLPFDLVQKFDRDILRDMHAQVLARRSFLQFLRAYSENHTIVPELSDLFEMDHKRNKLKFNRKKYELILYTSQVPCGAATIDINKQLFSGAKPLSSFQGIYSHSKQSIYDTNILRTKPGRLDIPPNKRSCSLSCTDKIMNWCVLGIQGKRLFQQYLPIYLDHIIIQSDNQLNIGKIRECFDVRERLSKLIHRKTKTIERKLFNVIVDGRQFPFTRQFAISIPTITVLQKRFNTTGVMKCQTSVVCSFDGTIQETNGHTGLKHGGSVKHLDKNKSSLASSVLLDVIPAQNKHYQYTAVKDRMKKLFGEWTTNYKDWRK